MTTTDRPAPTTPKPLNRRLKSWPGWVLMVLVAVAFVVVGATRTQGPLTQDDRVDDLTRRIACPVCDGESVYVSQNAASRRLRNQVEDLVRRNELSDDQILGLIDSRNEGDLLLVPRSSGLDALVWVLPAVAFVIGTAGLALAFRRWRLEAGGLGDPTDADRALVDAALADDEGRTTSITAEPSGPLVPGTDGPEADISVEDVSVADEPGADGPGPDPQEPER